MEGSLRKNTHMKIATRSKRARMEMIIFMIQQRCSNALNRIHFLVAPGMIPQKVNITACEPSSHRGRSGIVPRRKTELSDADKRCQGSLYFILAERLFRCYKRLRRKDL